MKKQKGGFRLDKLIFLAVIDLDILIDQIILKTAKNLLISTTYHLRATLIPTNHEVQSAPPHLETENQPRVMRIDDQGLGLNLQVKIDQRRPEEMNPQKTPTPG